MVRTKSESGKDARSRGCSDCVRTPIAESRGSVPSPPRGWGFDFAHASQDFVRLLHRTDQTSVRGGPGLWRTSSWANFYAPYGSECSCATDSFSFLSVPLAGPLFVRAHEDEVANDNLKSPNPLQMRVSEARRPKIRQKSVIHPQKPKKTVEKPHFPIDFVPAQAAW